MVFPSLADQLTLRARVLNCFACLRRRDTHFHSKPTQSHTHTHILAHMHICTHSRTQTSWHNYRVQRGEGERREGAVKTERAFNQPKKHSILSSVSPPPHLSTLIRWLPVYSRRREAVSHTHTHMHTRDRWHTRAALPTPTRSGSNLFAIYFFAFLIVVVDLDICCCCFTTSAPAIATQSALALCISPH